ncbi:OmpA family protein [Plantactinospora sp. ZYX-F-223]|uniref:OmpA family protein n=1 Tax=Plantactinospora sp. ZYX-F-223 TaxID=3144103 RepID=UPI0031FCEDC2
MFRSPSRGRHLPRASAAAVVGLLASPGLLGLEPTGLRAAPTPTPAPSASVLELTGAPPVGPITTPVVEVQTPALDVFSVTGTVQGDETEADSSSEVELTLAADVLFAFGKAELTPAARQRLDGAAERLRTQAAGSVHIAGHTDSIGTESSNLTLSRARAEAVRAHLAALLADVPLTFEVTGHGESRPVAANTTADGADNPSGRAKNRRVEIRYRK